MIVSYRPYAGIGSRETPPPIHPLILQVSARLARNGFTLRSGGARGADSLFEYAHRRAEPRAHNPFDGTEPTLIQPLESFRPEPPPPQWTYDLVVRYLDKGCRKDAWESFAPNIKGLLARNMQQILGRNGDSPSLFVLYWTAADQFEVGDAAGGTRYALRCAKDHGVPVLNLGRAGSSTVPEVLDWCRQQVISTSPPQQTAQNS